ncbi:hypothetical protein GCM10027259_52190 [Micromonospora palomenae]
MSFLDRYLRGEHDQVWADLRGLGPEVCDVAYLADARGVAEETMRRVRHNVEVLRTRLDQAGYRFKDPPRHRPFPLSSGGSPRTRGRACVRQTVPADRMRRESRERVGSSRVH